MLISSSMQNLIFLSLMMLLVQNLTNGFSSTYQRMARVNRPQKPAVFRPGRRGMTVENQGDEVSGENSLSSRRSWISRGLFVSSVVSIVAGSQLLLNGVGAYSDIPSGFKRIPIQFIAAVGDPTVSAGSNANDWGIWRVDPGPRGVRLQQYSSVLGTKGIAPAGWKFDPNDWWLEEHGLIMESPDFPLPPGKYLVTGGRAATSLLTVDEQQSWSLDGNTKLYDVTHLPCRSARYSPIATSSSGSPLNARVSDFPVTPGAEMPSVEGTNKQDYAVLFVIAVQDKLKKEL